MKTLYRFLAAVLLILLATPALAILEMKIVPAANEVSIGENFTVNVRGEGFENGITGGSFSLDYDPQVVHILNVSINETLFNFKAEAGTWDNIAGTLRGTGFDNLLGADDDSFEIATIALQAVGIGSSLLDLEPGEFAIVDKDNPTDLRNVVQFGDGSATVVPLPAAWLLMLSAGLLGVLVRKRL